MRWAMLCMSLALLVACGEPSDSWPERRPPAGFLQSPDNRAAGNALFHEHCARCHGTAEEGRSHRAGFFQPPAPDFLSPRYRTIDPAYLFWRISQGKNVEPYRSRGSVMPAWGPYFAEEQIWQLVAYLHARAGRRD